VQYDEWTVLDIVEELANLWGEGASIEIAQSSQLIHETSSLALDCSKAKRRLGWCPRLSLKNSLSLTCDWYKTWLQRYNMKDYTLNQIRSYE
jgi:CDP-glucose 4,6-dehydratase